jgi:hypothetical protein
MWSPVSHLELEAPLQMGPIQFVPISKDFLDKFESDLTMDNTDHLDDAKALVDNLRERMQGYAAVVVKRTAEAGRLREDGEAIARAAIGLLRFVAPAAANYPTLCPIAMLVSELAPSTSNIIRGETAFAIQQSADRRTMPSWQIPQTVYPRLAEFGLELLGKLIVPDGLSSFAFAVRSSILMHSTGETRSDPVERISYSFFAVEKLLLRHTAEAVEFNVAKRMAALGSNDREKRAEIARWVREAYRIRARRALTALAPHEDEAVRLFIQHAYLVLFKALKGINDFQTVPQFVAAIDEYERRGV